MPGELPFDNLLAVLFGFAFLPLVLLLSGRLGLYTVIREREAQVYTLFGKVLGTLEEPGIRFPLIHFGLKALLVPLFGEMHRVDTRLRQNYLRDQMVNSGEGTPMGVGIWYEMQVNDPVAYLFANANPEGSLEANVSSATISTLSNLEMDKMLEDRHQLSQQVRHTVSPLSEKWGYRLGSVYIRKVAFTDRQMVDNITEKVVKRLVQVTSAMKQDGENRVGLIKSCPSRRGRRRPQCHRQTGRGGPGGRAGGAGDGAPHRLRRHGGTGAARGPGAGIPGRRSRGGRARRPAGLTTVASLSIPLAAAPILGGAQPLSRRGKSERRARWRISRTRPPHSARRAPRSRARTPGFCAGNRPRACSGSHRKRNSGRRCH